MKGTSPGGARWVLLAGFGGLLALIVLSSVDALLVLRRIEATNNTIRREFVSRNHALNEIRASLYLTGTASRDYLLDPDAAAAGVRRDALRAIREQLSAQVAAYPVPANDLTAEIARFWDSLAPVFDWNAEQRRARGYAFLNDEVYPRRTIMLRLADGISERNEARLHEGGEQIAAMFADFRRRLIVVLGISLVLGAALAGVSISNTLRLERQAYERYLEIEQARGELKELSARLLEAQEEERRTISRELHDEVGQSLSAVLLELGGLSNDLPESSRPRLDAVKKLAESVVAVVRNMALLLRPSMLDDFGLLPALRWQAREVTRRTGLRVDVAADQEFTELPDEYKTCVFRVVQEALHNCARHAKATVCRVTLSQEASREGNMLRLAVQDNGRGFDVKQDRGLGLLGIQERVARLGGTVSVESEKSKGTQLAVTLPVA